MAYGRSDGCEHDLHFHPVSIDGGGFIAGIWGSEYFVFCVAAVLLARSWLETTLCVLSLRCRVRGSKHVLEGFCRVVFICLFPGLDKGCVWDPSTL